MRRNYVPTYCALGLALFGLLLGTYLAGRALTILEMKTILSRYEIVIVTPKGNIVFDKLTGQAIQRPALPLFSGQ